ncbi:hypothetical protein D3C77_444240 [compost metagenome]
MLSKPVLRLITGDPKMADVNRKLGRVIIIGGFAAENFTAEAVQAFNIIDFTAHIMRHVQCALYHFTAMKR